MWTLSQYRFTTLPHRAPYSLATVYQRALYYCAWNRFIWEQLRGESRGKRRVHHLTDPRELRLVSIDWELELSTGCVSWLSDFIGGVKFIVFCFIVDSCVRVEWPNSREIILYCVAEWGSRSIKEVKRCWCQVIIGLKESADNLN